MQNLENYLTVEMYNMGEQWYTDFRLYQYNYNKHKEISLIMLIEEIVGYVWDTNRFFNPRYELSFLIHKPIDILNIYG